MAHQAKDDTKPTDDAKKKQAGTVLLTAEELRAISGGGGAGVNNPTPVNPNPNQTLKAT